VLNTTLKVFEREFGKKPAVKAIHAGLECGLIGEKYPGMDMVSMGPQIESPTRPTSGSRSRRWAGSTPCSRPPSKSWPEPSTPKTNRSGGREAARICHPEDGSRRQAEEDLPELAARLEHPGGWEILRGACRNRSESL